MGISRAQVITARPPASTRLTTDTSGWREQRFGQRHRLYRRVLIGVPVAVLLVLGYLRRFICDDGLILTRSVRMIVAGHGPVFIAHERAELATSSLWQWLLVLLTTVFHADPAELAVYTGLILSVVGVGFAIAGTARLHSLAPGRGGNAFGPSTGTGAPTWLVPFGVVVWLAIPPVWDFATSGLETGLETMWIGSCWYLLVTARQGRLTPKQLLGVAFWFGLGVEVRPELALVAALWLFAMWLVVRPGPRRTLAWIATAVTVPIGYEIFRAGYYGILVPLPAVTKDAGGTMWLRGWKYVLNTVTPYWLWLPLLLVAMALIAMLVSRTTAREDRVIVAAPLVGSALLTLFLVKIGGDFMQARMLLTPLFLLLLPLLVVPLTKQHLIVAVAASAWAAVALSPLRQPFEQPTALYFQNIRQLSQVTTGRVNPVSLEDWKQGAVALSLIQPALHNRDPAQPTLYLGFDANYVAMSLLPTSGYRAVYEASFLGASGGAVPLSDGIVDMWDLSNPVFAHLQRDYGLSNGLGGMPGHEKLITPAWLLADWGDPRSPRSSSQYQVPPKALAAARHALRCGALRDLVASARGDLTAGRFLRNLVGSFNRTRLTIPIDPFAAEAKFCGATSRAESSSGR